MGSIYKGAISDKRNDEIALPKVFTTFQAEFDYVLDFISFLSLIGLLILCCQRYYTD